MFQINDARLKELDSVVLGRGNHKDGAGYCVMEAVAYVAGEKWSDFPACASPVAAAFLRRWNDDLDDKTRQKLKPYVARLVGSKASAAVESKRAWMLLDWLVRHYTPAWLELAGLKEQAAALRALAGWGPKTWAEGKPAIAEAGSKAAAAWAAAGASAGAAAAGDAAAGDAAAGAAAWAALRPTVVSLQASAFSLLDRMLAVGARP
jgi:hypothetical protein